MIYAQILSSDTFSVHTGESVMLKIKRPRCGVVIQDPTGQVEDQFIECKHDASVVLPPGEWRISYTVRSSSWRARGTASHHSDLPVIPAALMSSKCPWYRQYEKRR